MVLVDEAHAPRAQLGIDLLRHAVDPLRLTQERHQTWADSLPMLREAGTLVDDHWQNSRMTGTQSEASKDLAQWLSHEEGSVGAMIEIARGDDVLSACNRRTDLGGGS